MALIWSEIARKMRNCIQRVEVAGRRDIGSRLKENERENDLLYTYRVIMVSRY